MHEINSVCCPHLSYLRQPIFNTKQTARIIEAISFYPFSGLCSPIRKLIGKRFCNPQRSKSLFSEILNFKHIQFSQKQWLIAL